MNHYCTYFDANYLGRGLALHRSLAAHDGDFELTVLCMDDAAATALRAQALPNVRLLPLAELLQAHPPLAAARADRSRLEFYFTCTAWLMRHLLPALPPGELLTYLDADMYFFASPAPVFATIGNASVAITPHRFPESLAHLARYGRYNVGWVTLRQDATGQACAADWADRCAAWCFNRLEGDRYADQKYLDAWTERFPGTVGLDDPGVNAAPWNIKDAVVAGGPGGVRINDRPLIFYHFHGLVELGRQLYDTGLHRYDAAVSAGLREWVYLPYLRALHAGSAGETPDIVPPQRADDPRSGLALAHLWQRLQASELDRATRLESIERNRAEAEAAITEARAATQKTIDYYAAVERDRDASQVALREAHAATEKTIAYLKLVENDRNEARAALDRTVAYLQSVESDSAERLKSIEFYQGKLKEAYSDLERNVAYLKSLEAEVQAHAKLAADRDTVIAELARQLAAARSPATPGA